MPIPWITHASEEFPPLEMALDEPNGLLAAGGELSVTRLLSAYSHGIFPWYEDGQPVLWWSPDPRLVLYPGKLHVSRSLARLVANHPYRISLDEDFESVIRACAKPRRRGAGTWITESMVSAYTELHARGYAHSIEVWHGKELVGGLYGIALGRVFFGESMFSHASNTSKLALVYLTRQLHRWGYELIDCQVTSAHLQSLGAVEISREAFSRALQQLVVVDGSAARWQLQPDLLE
jgi:leucyl/phenylalanyl-tRNA--protein transferase